MVIDNAGAHSNHVPGGSARFGKLLKHDPKSGRSYRVSRRFCWLQANSAESVVVTALLKLRLRPGVVRRLSVQFRADCWEQSLDELGRAIRPAELARHHVHFALRLIRKYPCVSTSRDAMTTSAPRTASPSAVSCPIPIPAARVTTMIWPGTDGADVTGRSCGDDRTCNPSGRPEPCGAVGGLSGTSTAPFISEKRYSV